MTARRPKTQVAEMLTALERGQRISLFAMLGVHAGSSEDEIRDRRLAFARVLHPDRNADPRAASAMAEVNRAVSVLLDKALRQAYMTGFRRSSRCPACEGRGYLQKTKGWAKQERTACLGCAGAGYRERATG